MTWYGMNKSLKLCLECTVILITYCRKSGRATSTAISTSSILSRVSNSRGVMLKARTEQEWTERGTRLE